MMVQATLTIYKAAVENFFPTPSKSHYVSLITGFLTSDPRNCALPSHASVRWLSFLFISSFSDILANMEYIMIIVIANFY